MRKLNGFVALGLAIVVAMAGGQAAFATANPSDGTLDTTFNPVLAGVSAGNTVLDSVRQPDGKVVLVGSFLTYNNTAAKYVVRINIDGSIDSSFSIGSGPTTSGSSLQVKAVALQTDGKILIGGAFEQVQGQPSLAVARLNIDGTFDSTFTSPIAPFNSSTNANVAVSDLAVLSDGSVLITGSFAQGMSGGSPISVNGLIKTNTSGTLDTGFNTNFGGATGGTINVSNVITAVGSPANVITVAVQSDGKLLIGGTFNIIGGTSIRRGLARLLLSGAIDTSFDAVLSGASRTVYDIEVDANNKIVAVGAMDGAGSTAAKGIVRLDPTTGAYDSTFTGPIAAGFSGSSSLPTSLAIASDGTIYAAGLFTAYNTVSRAGLVRLAADGSLDTSFTVGAGVVSGGAAGNGRTIIPLLSGDVLVGGIFDTFNGVARSGLVLLTSTAAIAARTAPSNSSSSNSNSNSNSSNSSGSSSSTVGSGNSSGSSIASGSNTSSIASPGNSLAETGTRYSMPIAVVGAFAVLVGLGARVFMVARRRRTQ